MRATIALLFILSKNTFCLVRKSKAILEILPKKHGEFFGLGFKDVDILEGRKKI